MENPPDDLLSLITGLWAHMYTAHMPYLVFGMFVCWHDSLFRHFVVYSVLDDLVESFLTYAPTLSCSLMI